MDSGISPLKLFLDKFLFHLNYKEILLIFLNYHKIYYSIIIT